MRTIRNRRMVGKKAMYLPVLLFLIVLLVLSYAFLASYQEVRKINLYVGTRQSQLIKAYQEGERALFYTDTAAKLAAYSSLYQNGLSAGFSFTGQPECGTYMGFALYVNETAECWPDLIKDLEPAFNSELNRMLAGNPYDIPALDYSFQAEEEEGVLVLRGISQDKITIPIDGYERDFFIDRDKVVSSHSFATDSSVTSYLNFGKIDRAENDPAKIDLEDLKQVKDQASFDAAVASGKLVYLRDIPFLKPYGATNCGREGDASYIKDASSYGRPQLKEYLTELAKEFHEKFNEDFLLGDAFAPTNCGHASHYRGIAIDVGYDAGDARGIWVAEKTRNWCSSAQIFYNDKTSVAAGYSKALSGHDDHLHIDYKCSGFKRFAQAPGYGANGPMPSTTETGKMIVNTALLFEGVEYSYGGRFGLPWDWSKHPNAEQGIDCSGLVYVVSRQLGIIDASLHYNELNWDTDRIIGNDYLSGQSFNNQEIMDSNLDLLQPGDFITVDHASGGHVGIYYGKVNGVHMWINAAGKVTHNARSNACRDQDRRSQVKVASLEEYLKSLKSPNIRAKRIDPSLIGKYSLEYTASNGKQIITPKIDSKLCNRDTPFLT